MTVVNAVEQIRSSKGGRPTREAAAELGERILDIALEHFLRYGFEGQAHGTRPGGPMPACAQTRHSGRNT